MQIRIFEALPLSWAKEYTKMSAGKWHNLYPQIFPKGQDRVYFPFTKEVEEGESPVYQLIEEVLAEYDNYEISDYKGGYATKLGQKYKIGKLLNQIANDNKVDSDLATSAVLALSQFNSDPVRSNRKYLIVISRHPYDIAGMSTDRAWKSCMNLDVETNGNANMAQTYLPNAIQQGSIVAYLIGDNDKNINKPFARVTVKPYTSGRKSPFLRASDSQYGLSEYKKDLQKQVQAILDEKYNSVKADLVANTYKHKRDLYQDADPNVIGKVPPVIMGTYKEYEQDDKKIARVQNETTGQMGWIWVPKTKSQGDTVPARLTQADIIFPMEYYDISKAKTISVKGTNMLVCAFKKDKDGKYGIMAVQPEPRIILEPTYNHIDISKIKEQKVAIVSTDEGYGALGENLENIVPCEFKHVAKLRMFDITGKDLMQNSPLFQVGMKDNMAGVYDSVSKKLIIPGEQDIEYYYIELKGDDEIIKGRNANGTKVESFDMKGNKI